MFEFNDCSNSLRSSEIDPKYEVLNEFLRWPSTKNVVKKNHNLVNSPECILNHNMQTEQIQSSFNNNNWSCKMQETSGFQSFGSSSGVLQEYINTNPSNFLSYINEQKSRYISCEPAHKTRSTLKINMKRKRKRTTFTTEQIIALEEVFQKRPYVNRDERLAMMHRLQVSEKAIKIWFQNRRRVTDKRGKDYASDSPSSDDMSESITDRLTFIESHIKENTDEAGFVTLNDGVMNELVNIIDEYLSQDVSLSKDVNSLKETNLLSSHSSRTEQLIMYEPISPVSLSENTDDGLANTVFYESLQHQANTHPFLFW